MQFMNNILSDATNYDECIWRRWENQPVTTHRTMRWRGNGLKWQQWRFGLDIRHSFLTGRVVKHLNRLPRAVMEPPSLEGFKIRVEVALEDTAQ